MPADRSMRRLTRLAFLVLAAALAIFVLRFAAALDAPHSTPIELRERPLELATPPASLSAPPEHAPAVRLGFVGDIMQHRAQAGDDFDASYAEIAPLLRRFDRTIGNLEFPVHPGRPVGPPPASVRFNGSGAHLDALAGAGFDILSTANNHAFDQGLEGARATLDELAARGLVAVGTGSAAALRIVEVEGVRIAFAAYTDPPNSYPDDDGEIQWWSRDWPINALNFRDWTGAHRRQGRRLFARHIADAAADGAGIEIALVHWGEEWVLEPSPDQRRAARDMIDAGFDLVVGSHAHVINGVELYEGRVIAYSLGNFISDFVPTEVRTGAVLEVDLARDPGDGSPIAGFRVYPALTRRDGHVVVPLTGEETGEAADAWAFARRLLGPALTPAPTRAAPPTG